MLQSTITALLLSPLALAHLIPRQILNVTSADEGSAVAAPDAPFTVIYPSTSNGRPITIRGLAQDSVGQNEYLGIPYGQPPIGEKRFCRPEPAVWNVSSYNATRQPPACLQPPSKLIGAFGDSEACLNLNVFVPQGYENSSSLPVMVWVYGGDFKEGSPSTYSGRVIVNQSVENNQPIVFVAIAYRVGFFGWPFGAEAAANGAGNLGLKDITLALEWVQENIWAFGGDNSQVTVAGQSAGSVSTALLFLNEKQNLFRSAIMQSGGQSTVPLAPTADAYNDVYKAILNATGCLNASDGTPWATYNSTALINGYLGSAPDANIQANDASWQCLKALPSGKLLNATSEVANITEFEVAFIFGPSIDGDLIPDSPHTLLEQGKFARIPFIAGNVLDEGAYYSSPMLTNETQAGMLIDALEHFHPPNMTIIQELLQAYPPDSSVEEPFNTGNDTFGLSPVFKQMAALIGDASFVGGRRWFTRQAQQHGWGDHVWTYLYSAKQPGTEPQLGVYHGSDIAYVFGVAQNITGTFTERDAQFSREIIDYWLNFVVYTDPSGGPQNLTYWPALGDNLNMLQLNYTNTTVITDTYREKQIDYFFDRPQVFNY